MYRGFERILCCRLSGKREAGESGSEPHIAPLVPVAVWLGHVISHHYNQEHLMVKNCADGGAKSGVAATQGHVACSEDAHMASCRLLMTIRPSSSFIIKQSSLDLPEFTYAEYVVEPRLHTAQAVELARQSKRGARESYSDIYRSGYAVLHGSKFVHWLAIFSQMSMSTYVN